MFRSKPIVPGGGGGRGSEQHVCKVILVISLSLSQAEQLKIMNEMGRGVRVGLSDLPPGLFNVEPSYFLDGKTPKKMSSFYV